ncbi:hypothetical protein D3C72_1735800 [compost metagenome]
MVVARVLVLPEADGVENKEFQFGAKVANRGKTGLPEVQLGLACDMARIARVRLVQDRVQHVADQRQRWCRAKRIDECRGRVRPDQHVGLVYFLEPTNGRPVEPDAGREQIVVDFRQRDREMLPCAGQVGEPEVNDLDRVLLDQSDDFSGILRRCNVIAAGFY